MTVASIRSNNPGAMWGNKLATKWGATKSEVLHDGLGQGNNIAYFPTKVQGACAQFDLWRTGYTGRTLRAAITKWSGGNWSQPYANFLTQHLQCSIDTMIDNNFLSGPTGWKLMKYQAQWEAGQPYPMTDEEWQKAQSIVFGAEAPKTISKATKTKTAASTVVVSTTAAAGAAVKGGVSWWMIFAIVAAGVVALAVAIWLVHKHHESSTTAKPTNAPPPPAQLDLPKGG